MDLEKIVLAHSEQIGEMKGAIASAHKRIDNTDIFMKELSKMNINMTKMNGNIELLANEIKAISKTIVIHDEAIEELTGRIVSEEQKEGAKALADLNSFKRWVITSVGVVVIAIVLAYLRLQ